MQLSEEGVHKKALHAAAEKVLSTVGIPSPTACSFSDRQRLTLPDSKRLSSVGVFVVSASGQGSGWLEPGSLAAGDRTLCCQLETVLSSMGRRG
eukprot:1689099-Rhodomonas_salina.3